MSATAALAQGRAAAEALMIDTCTIRRASGVTTDPDTGVTTPTYGADVYSGKCKVQQRQVQATQSDVGEAYVLLLRLEVHIPMAVTGVQADDELTINSSFDPDLTSRTFVVRELAHKTYATARRLGVQERTS